jgi:hypothetical protein
MTDIARVKELLGQGLSRPQIAQRLHTSYHAIRIACDALGIPRRNGGRPPRDDSHALTNLLDKIRDHAQRAGLFFRTTRGKYLFYDGRPIASFTDARAAWAWLSNPTRRGASIQLHALRAEAAVTAVKPTAPTLNGTIVRTPMLDGCSSLSHNGV